MRHELERSEGIACSQNDCYYWDALYEQNCSKQDSVGDPGPASCIDYRPNKSLNSDPP